MSRAGGMRHNFPLGLCYDPATYAIYGMTVKRDLRHDSRSGSVRSQRDLCLIWHRRQARCLPGPFRPPAYSPSKSRTSAPTAAASLVAVSRVILVAPDSIRLICPCPIPVLAATSCCEISAAILATRKLAPNVTRSSADRSSAFGGGVFGRRVTLRAASRIKKCQLPPRSAASGLRVGAVPG